MLEINRARNVIKGKTLHFSKINLSNISSWEHIQLWLNIDIKFIYSISLIFPQTNRKMKCLKKFYFFVTFPGLFILSVVFILQGWTKQWNGNVFLMFDHWHEGKTSPFAQCCVWSGHLGHFGTIRKTFWCVGSIQTVFPVISDHFHPLSAHWKKRVTDPRTDGRTDPLIEMRGRI